MKKRSDSAGVARRRNRKPISCTSCRERKYVQCVHPHSVALGCHFLVSSCVACAYVLFRLRCDRSLPACSNCLSRQESGSCDYFSEPRVISTSSRSRNGTPYSCTDLWKTASTSGPKSLDGKLELLERLIQQYTALRTIPSMESQSEQLGKAHQTAADDPTMLHRTTPSEATFDCKEPTYLRSRHLAKTPAANAGHQSLPSSGNSLWERMMGEVITSL